MFFQSVLLLYVIRDLGKWPVQKKLNDKCY
jgi:hypothetical protein